MTAGRAVLELEQVRIDLERGHLNYGDGRQCVLTTREQALLQYLVAREGQTVERDVLEREVFGLPGTAPSRAVDVTVARLRKKLEADTRRPVHLQTVHGSGYRWSVGRGDASPLPASPPASVLPRFQLGNRVVDLELGIVEAYGRRAHLTAAERHLLLRLLNAPGPLSPDDLAPRWMRGAQACARVAKTVHRLRMKLEEDPTAPRFLLRVRGAGYRLVRPAAAPVVGARPKSFVWTSVRHLGQTTGLHDGVVYWRSGEELRQVAAFGPKTPAGEEISRPLVLPLARGMVGATATLNEVQRVPDTRWDRHYVPDEVSGRSELAVPVRVGDEVVGAAVAASKAA